MCVYFRGCIRHWGSLIASSLTSGELVWSMKFPLVVLSKALELYWCAFLWNLWTKKRKADYNRYYFEAYHLCHLSPKILVLGKTLHLSLSQNTCIGLKGTKEAFVDQVPLGLHICCLCVKLSFHSPSLPFHWPAPTRASGPSLKSSEDHPLTSPTSHHPTFSTQWPLVRTSKSCCTFF